MEHGYYLKCDMLLKSILTAVVILAIITGIGLINQGALAQVQQQQQVYKDPQKKFTIQYPSSWEVAPRDSSFPYYGTATAIAFKPTSEGNDPLSHSLFNITPTDIEKSLDKTTLQVKPKNLDQVASDFIEFLKTPSSVLGDLKVEVLKNNATTIGGLPARQIQYLAHSIGTFEMQV
jgi:ABC-type sulfate/molybdate transport systems ATPase subunit